MAEVGEGGRRGDADIADADDGDGVAAPMGQDPHGRCPTAAGAPAGRAWARRALGAGRTSRPGPMIMNFRMSPIGTHRVRASVPGTPGTPFVVPFSPVLSVCAH